MTRDWRRDRFLAIFLGICRRPQFRSWCHLPVAISTRRLTQKIAVRPRSLCFRGTQNRVTRTKLLIYRHLPSATQTAAGPQNGSRAAPLCGLCKVHGVKNRRCLHKCSFLTCQCRAGKEHASALRHGRLSREHLKKALELRNAPTTVG
jgi:hypothetical protein